MKTGFYALAGAVAIIGICLLAYADAFSYLEVTTGGIRIGGTGDAGANKIQFMPSSQSYILDSPDTVADAGLFRFVGEDRALMLSDGGANATRAMVEADVLGNAKLKGRLIDDGAYYGNSGVNASADGSAHMISVPTDDTAKVYARISTLANGAASMSSAGASSVVCTADGDVVITLGAAAGTQQQSGFARGLLESTEGMALPLDEELPPNMLTPHHDMPEDLEID